MIFRFLFDKKDNGKRGKSSKKKKVASSRKGKTVSGRKNKPERAISKKEKNIQKVGKITHYFPKVKAAVVKMIKGPLEIGDVVYIKGSTTEFKQKVASMQIEHKPVKVAQKGDLIGLEVKRRVRKRDLVFKEF